MEGSTTSHPPYCPPSFSQLLAWNDSLLQNTSTISLAAMSWQSWVKHKTDQQGMIFSSKNARDCSENMWLGFGCGSQFSSWATTLAQVSSDQDCCLVWWLLKLECCQIRSAWIWFGEICLCICICIRIPCVYLDWLEAMGRARLWTSREIKPRLEHGGHSLRVQRTYNLFLGQDCICICICICISLTPDLYLCSFILHYEKQQLIMKPDFESSWECSAPLPPSTVQEILFCQLWLLASFGIFGIFWQVLASFGNCRTGVVWQFEQFQATMSSWAFEHLSSWAARLGSYRGPGNPAKSEQLKPMHVTCFKIHVTLSHVS